MKSRKRWWTGEDDVFLIENAHKLYCDELQELLGAERHQILTRCKALGVSPKKKRRRLTESEKEIIMRNPVREAAILLGIRSKASIRDYKKRLKKSGFVSREFQEAEESVTVKVEIKTPVAEAKVIPIQSAPSVINSGFKNNLRAILAKFPRLTQGQRRMASDIFQYSPSSAHRYAKFVSRPSKSEGKPRNKVGRPCN